MLAAAFFAFVGAGPYFIEYVSFVVLWLALEDANNTQNSNSTTVT